MMNDERATGAAKPRPHGEARETETGRSDVVWEGRVGGHGHLVRAVLWRSKPATGAALANVSIEACTAADAMGVRRWTLVPPDSSDFRGVHAEVSAILAAVALAPGLDGVKADHESGSLASTILIPESFWTAVNQHALKCGGDPLGKGDTPRAVVERGSIARQVVEIVREALAKRGLS